MTSKTAVVFTCAHSSPEVDNSRFKALGNFLFDLKPDLVFDLGDFDDMKSLNTYDSRYPQAIVRQNYEADIEAGQVARDLIWKPFKKAKKKRPFRVGFEGNHENRIKKAIAHDPRLEGQKYGISFGHLQTDYWYDEYHEYSNSAPTLADYLGVTFGHYVSTGAYGSAMSTKHHGYSLIERLNCSVTVGHSHKFSYYHKAESRPYPVNGLVAGCFKGANESWAGQANNEWRKGLCIKRELENGDYDLTWYSLKALMRDYGNE